MPRAQAFSEKPKSKEALAAMEVDTTVLGGWRPDLIGKHFCAQSDLMGKHSPVQSLCIMHQHSGGKHHWVDYWGGIYLRLGLCDWLCLK